MELMSMQFVDIFPPYSILVLAVKSWLCIVSVDKPAAPQVECIQHIWVGGKCLLQQSGQKAAAAAESHRRFCRALKICRCP